MSTEGGGEVERREVGMGVKGFWGSFAGVGG